MVKINARECTIRELEKETEKNFLEDNHAQGYAKSKICYGLYLNGELVQLMSLGKPRFNKNYQWEIIRECTKKNTIVRGGTSKLWKFFIENNRCRSCICYHYPHDEDSLYTSHLVDNCGFKCEKKAKPEKKIYFEGLWDGELKRIDKSILERHGVDRILKTKQGQDRTNEEILIDLGFERKLEDGYSPQIDVYYPFGVVFRVDDLTDNVFYIGMTEVEEKWNNNYLGSGGRWSNHLNSHPNNNYKRTLLYQCKTPKETRDKELKEIEKYFEFNGEKWIKTDNNCMNTHVRSQSDDYILPICDECGARLGSHKKICSKYHKPEPCTECGAVLGHKKGCSKYKEPKRCHECGSIKGHKKNCSNYKQPKLCEECGSIGGHRKTCSQYKRQKLCGECGSPITSHKKNCSNYRELKRCPKCGGLRVHKKDCSKYKATPCEECGSLSAHKKTCSKYKEKTVCEECGHMPHLKTCSKYKEIGICRECGGLRGQHKKNCSKFEEVGVCEECGGKLNAHKKSCSKYNRVSCPECGSFGSHKKTCSKYTAPEPCSECGSRYSHKSSCSQYKPPTACPECGGTKGHKSTCSKYNKKTCPECGHTPHLKTCSHYKQPDICPECGGNRRHKPGCSKFIICEECGGKGGSHKKTCSKHNRRKCPECGSISQHKSTCSRYKKPSTPDPCPECSGIYSHKKTCSKFTQSETCPECGMIRSHSKSCSRAKLCPECGGYPGNHKEDCSRAKRCPECGRANGRHNKDCSKYPKCKECGVPRGSKHKPGCSKYKPLCQECGHSPHLKSCSKYKRNGETACPECGRLRGHKENCSLKHS